LSKEKDTFFRAEAILDNRDGLHHKKLLGFKEEQNIYMTNRTTGYIDNLTR
jgi:hypothetical protein